jgi:prophage antirepressor-like protein
MVNSIEVLKQTELCGQQFAVYGTAENPLFHATDVASVLELTNVTDMVSRVDEDERSKFNLGRQGETWLLTEDGLYEVLMQSRKPIAKQFKKGVKAILKEIRTKGGYIASKVDDTPEVIMARALQIAQITIENHRQRVQMLEGENDLLEKENRQLAPKAGYTDKVLQSTSTYTMTQVAKEIGMSAVALEKHLHDEGVMFRQSGQWILYAKYQDKGYTKTRTHHYNHSDGTTGTNTITVWTEAGRAFVHHLFASNRFLTEKQSERQFAGS